ncbi:MAG: M6 family metalloprotease domain-containing protein [bacterium]|nr:M6 family metalloprotease domain-containing protein [bacterium]
MKVFKLIALLFFSLIINVSYGQISRSNCSVKEETFDKQNPDGSHVTVRVFGNEMITYFETIEGLTLVENKSGFMEYATLDLNQNLVGSGVVAKNELKKTTLSTTPHLRYSEQQISIIQASFYQNNQVNLKKAGGKPFPSKGNRKVLTLLIQYPDLPASIAKSNFDSLLMKKNYNGTGSFRDYYLKSSFNQLDLSVDVFGWYMASNTYMNYGKSSPNYNYNVGELVKRAILAADSAGVDFSKYDNDSDGYVDGIIIMHAGIGAEEQSAPSANNYIWSHRYNLAYSVGSVMVDGVLVDSYGIFPEKRYSGGAYTQVGIGVISHEFGHLIDLPDIYSTQSKGEGAGNFANMAGGPWLNNEKTPCMHDAWTRLVMQWNQPVVINSNGTYTIPKSLADSNFAFRINTSQANEFFLIENRQKKGFDQYLPGKGLAIWHINSSKARLLSAGGSNNVNNDTSAYGVGLMQADGNRDLEKGTNRGDAGDLFPGNTNNRNFNSYTNPNSSLHYKLGGVKQASNLVISNITQNADSSISFTLGNNPTAAFNAEPLKGCAPLNVNLINISNFANRYLWKYHDGTTSSEENPTKFYPNSGSFPITLLILDSNGVAIDSNTQTISVNVSPTAVAQIVRLDSNQFSLKNNSEGALYSIWKFGSNQTSTANELIYKISGAADIPFKLIAFSANQCSDTSSGILSFWALGVNESQFLVQANAYPNPFNNELNLEFTLQNKCEIAISLRDIQGKLIWEKKEFKSLQGKNLISVPTKDIQMGVYIIELSGPNFNKILRVTAQ